jgi:starch synthase
MLKFNYNKDYAEEGKWEKKNDLCRVWPNPNLPLFRFIGRFAEKKGQILAGNCEEEYPGDQWIS